MSPPHRHRGGTNRPLQEFPPGLERQPLGTVSIIGVVAPSHERAEHDSAPSPTARLRGRTQLVPTDRSQLTEGIDLSVLSPRTWRMADLGARHECLRAGLGRGNMPRHLVVQDLERGALVQIHPAEWQQELVVPQLIIHRASDPPGPAGQCRVDRLGGRRPRGAPPSPRPGPPAILDDRDERWANTPVPPCLSA